MRELSIVAEGDGEGDVASATTGGEGEVSAGALDGAAGAALVTVGAGWVRTPGGGGLE
ncbi:MAG: hypothetical protein ABR598_06685 [Candidatus Dormibacteria bacterium]